jgi:hypothetical protein
MYRSMGDIKNTLQHPQYVKLTMNTSGSMCNYSIIVYIILAYAVIGNDKEQVLSLCS